VDGLRRVTVARFVGERTGQALGFGQQLGIRLETRDPGGGAAGDIARQQRVVDVKAQRQQGQYLLLAR